MNRPAADRFDSQKTWCHLKCHSGRVRLVRLHRDGNRQCGIREKGQSNNCRDHEGEWPGLLGILSLHGIGEAMNELNRARKGVKQMNDGIRLMTTKTEAGYSGDRTRCQQEISEICKYDRFGRPKK